MPFRSVKLLVNINNIQLLIHPQLMHVIAYKHSPVLRRIRILADFFGDHFAEAGFLGEPFPAHAGDGVPADLHRPEVGVHQGLAWGDLVGFGAEAEGVLEGELAFEETLKTLFFTFVQFFVSVTS